MMLADKKVFVGRFKSRGDRMREFGERAKQFTNLYIKNLPESWDDAKLEEEFKVFGEILSHKITFDNETGVSKCFGFISFKEHEEAEAAVEAMDGKEIEGKVFLGNIYLKEVNNFTRNYIAVERRKKLSAKES